VGSPGTANRWSSTVIKKKPATHAADRRSAVVGADTVIR
jgi:hypothetical protein